VSDESLSRQEKLLPRNGRFYDGPLGLVAAAAVHVALFFALFYVFQWNTDSETVYAELWAPEDASGRNVQGQSSETTDEMPPEPEMNKASELADANETVPEPAPQPQPAPNPEPKPEPAPAPAPQPAPAPKPEPQPEPDSEPTEEELRREANIKLAQQRAEEARLKKEKAEAEAARRLREEEARLAEEQRLAEEKRLEEERIAEEKRLEEARRAEEARIAEEKRLEEERIAAEKQRKAEEARKKRIAQEKARQAKIAEEMRQAELARITGAKAVETGRVGTTKGDKTAVRQNLTGSMTAAYAAQVVARIRPLIAYPVPPNIKRGNNIAIFDVRLLPDGTVASYRKVQSSGLPAFDAAVDRAIKRSGSFPRPRNGAAVPRQIQILFDPVDSQ